MVMMFWQHAILAWSVGLCYLLYMVKHSDIAVILKDLQKEGAGGVHLVGIGGIGMAGLAFHLKACGFEVDGCDIKANELFPWLESRDIPVSSGHDPAHMKKGPALVVRSAAVTLDCPEITCAIESGIPVFRRGEVLPALFDSKTLVAVAGTHGKTTTSSFVAQLLMHAGKEPDWCIGGNTSSLGAIASASSGSRTVVVEADESDGTLCGYAPDIGVVTNIDFDHMENFADRDEFEHCFMHFIKSSRKLFYCADYPRTRLLCAGRTDAFSYGFCEDSFIRAVDISSNGFGLSFTILKDGRQLGRVTTSFPGRHNILNVLAAVSVAEALVNNEKPILGGVKKLVLPGRRFERVVDSKELLVISDYAHHPSEIAALVQTVTGVIENDKSGRYKRVIAVFQPHRYSRTLALRADFPSAFKGVNEVMLLPVYPASENPLQGGTVWDLYEEFRRSGFESNCRVCGSLHSAQGCLQSELQAGDVLLVIGAGDVLDIARWAEERKRYGSIPLHSDTEHSGDYACDIHDKLRRAVPGVEILRNKKAGARTTYGVGGIADLMLDVENEDQAAVVSHICYEAGQILRVLGAGSNILVSDCGVGGVIIRLAGQCFRKIEICADGLVAGAGLSVKVLLDYLEEKELSGMEFLESIPGLVGGALAMNAGAWGHEIADRVKWVRYCDSKGQIHTEDSSAMHFGYRKCKGLENSIALETCLDVSSSSKELIRNQRNEYAARRGWLRGFRSAGSVFINPEGDFAGRLLDDAGMKGFRIGGAVFSDYHANVIIAEQGACSSDIMALVEKAREEVASRFKVKLETEVVIWKR